MMSTFTGLYVQRLSTGVICDVQVIDAAGNENSLDPEVYLQRGLKPPIEQLPDVDEYNKSMDIAYKIPKERTLKSIIGWATISAVIVALLAAEASTLYYCYGVAYDSQTCSWPRAYFPLTSGLIFVIAWPVCFIVGFLLNGLKAPNPAFKRDSPRSGRAP